MLDFLQDFYFSLYISTWTSFKWLLFSVLIAIGCCLATFLFEFKGKIDCRWYYSIHHQSFQSIVLILHGKEIMRGKLFSRCCYVKKIKNKPPLKK